MGPYRTPAESHPVRSAPASSDREERIVHGVLALGGLIGVTSTAVAADFGAGFVVAVALLVLGLHGVFK